MTGATFEVKFDQAELKRFRHGLELLIRAGREPGPILLEAGSVIVENTDERWKREIDPDGRPWEKLNPAYEEWKRKKGRIDKILQSTGRLRGSIVHQLVAQDMLSVGTNVEYAAVMHYGPRDSSGGFRAGRKATSTMKARPFLGFSKEDKAAIERIMRRHIKAALAEL